MTIEKSPHRTVASMATKSSPQPVGIKRTRKQSKITDAFSPGRPARADGRALLKEQTLNVETASPLSPKQLVKRQRPARRATINKEEKTIQQVKLEKRLQVELIVESKQDKLEAKSKIELESPRNEARSATEPAYKKYAHLLEESQMPLPTTPSSATPKSPSKLIPSPHKTSSPCKSTPSSESSLTIAKDSKGSQDNEENSLKALVADSVTIATSSTSLLIKEPIIPAHQRFVHLLSSAPIAIKLPLPAKFILLERILGAIDSLLMVAMGRGQPVIFHRAISTLEATVGRRVEERHIKQLVSILSDDNKSPFRFRRVKTVIEGRRVDSFVMELPEHPTHEFLAHRRDTLHLRLQERIFNCHQSFLESIKYVLPPGAILKAWHPDFDLEGVADLEEVELFPKPPPDVSAIPQEIQNALSVNHTFSPTKTLENHSKDKEVASSTTSSVLERIRAKQRATQLASITQTSIDASKHQQQTLVDLSSRLALLFHSTSKSTLPLSEVVDKLVSGSHLAISPAEIVALIDELSRKVTGWISIMRPTNSKETPGLGDRMVRINRSITLAMAQKQLQS